MRKTQTQVNEQDVSKKDIKKKLLKLVKNKYILFGLLACAISGTYITIDVLNKKEDVVKKADKSELLSSAYDYISNIDSVSINTTIDMFLKLTMDNVTSPYMLGQAVNYDIIANDPYMIHSNGKTVFQANGGRITKRYERYEEIGEETTKAYDNREDIIWVKRNYENERNIMDSLAIFELIKEQEDNFHIEELYKIKGKTCYVIEGEMQYKDLLPYLTDMVCFENGDRLLNAITRNGFYGFVKVYINVDTGFPERLYIDFSEVARAFAEVDGGNEGWSAAISTFYFQLDFSNYNSIENIEIDLSVKDNAIDEMIFWERLKNGDLTYEELVFYQMLFGYNKTEFDYYMEKMGVTQEEYDMFLTLFNFDANGNSQFPVLLQAEYNYLKGLFAQDLGYEYYYNLLGLSREEYEYYLNFFAVVPDYGNYMLFEGMSYEQYEYYKQVLNIANGSYEAYEQVMQYVQSSYKYEIPNIKQSEFDYILNLFAENHNYEYFKQQFNWTREQYEALEQIFNFINNTYNSAIKYNTNFKSKYEYYQAIIYIMNKYELNLGTFSYTQREFEYYLSLFNYIGSYDNYGNYVIDNNATAAYYQSLYNIIAQTTDRFETFQEFYNYIQQVGHDAFVQEFHIESYNGMYNPQVGEKAEITPGVNEGGELSNNWYSYSFKYNNAVIGLPVKYNDFVNATGFSLKSTEEGSQISAGNTATKTLYKDGTKNTIAVILENDSSAAKSITECTIVSITISQTLSDDEIGNFLLPSGIKIGDSITTVNLNYDEPYSSTTNGGLTSYIYRSSGRNETMKMTFSNNKLTKVTFTLGS